MYSPDSLQMACIQPPHKLTVRPLTPRDAMALQAAFHRLSRQSRYQRFLGDKEQLSPAELERLINLDHVDHEAIAAFVAGELVGVARYIRDHADPTIAEVAVTVADMYQGCGVGTLLLRRLVERARDEGLTRFLAVMLVENRGALAFLKRSCPVRVSRYVGAGVLEVDLDLPRAITQPRCPEDAARQRRVA